MVVPVETFFVLKRFGLFFMLMLAGWIPLQSVAAWQMMTQSAMTLETNVPSHVMTTSHQKMMDSAAMVAGSCHEMSASKVVQSDSSDHAMGGQHGSHCTSCLALCSGFPVSAVLFTESFSPRAVMTPVIPQYFSDADRSTLERPPRLFKA